jgi:hypothetical protein
MAIEYDGQGKINAGLVRKLPVLAVVQTTGQLIRGKLHVREGERLQDELDRDEPFLAMTDATVVGPEEEVLFQAPFLAVRRSQIIWVLPIRDEAKSKP